MENSQQLIWNEIKQFYKEKFGIEPELVEVMSDLNIIRMCASGTSNFSIAKMFDMDTDIISYVINKHFGFKGWPIDLTINPLAIYKQGCIDTEEYYNKLVEIGFTDNQKESEFMRGISKIVSNLERMLDDEWV